MTSTYAAAAKIIRKELKKNGITAKVSAKSYSGGSSVDVYTTDLLPAALKEVKLFCGQFEMGHFDGMIDMYEYSNINADLPQVKFVRVNNTYSDKVKQAAWNWMRSYYADMDDAPENYKDGGNHQVMGTWGDQMLHRVLSDERKSGFWATYKPRVKA